MSHQAGVRQVVATAGTALTEQQLKALGRFTPDIRLSFDADRAGANATERAIPIAGKVGVSLSIIDIPSGKDPDELIKQNPETWEKIIEHPKYALDWIVERYVSLLDLKSAQGKREFSDVLLPIVQRLTDSVEQDHYLNKIAELMQVSRSALDAKLKKTVDSAPPPRRRKQPIARQEPDKVALENSKTQNHLLAIVLKNPPLRRYLQLLNTEMFIDPRAGELYKFLQSNPDFSSDSDGLPKEVQNLAEYAKILLLQYEELYQGLDELELRYEAARLQTRVTEQFVKHEKEKMIVQLGSSDEASTKTILEQAKELDALLKQAREGKDG
jgi:DNA primase